MLQLQARRNSRSSNRSTLCFACSPLSTQPSTPIFSLNGSDKKLRVGSNRSSPFLVISRHSSISFPRLTVYPYCHLLHLCGLLMLFLAIFLPYLLYNHSLSHQSLTLSFRMHVAYHCSVVICVPATTPKPFITGSLLFHPTRHHSSAPPAPDPASISFRAPSALLAPNPIAPSPLVRPLATFPPGLSHTQSSPAGSPAPMHQPQNPPVGDRSQSLPLPA